MKVDVPAALSRTRRFEDGCRAVLDAIERSIENEAWTAPEGVEA